jgi:hypothetical protein
VRDEIAHIDAGAIDGKEVGLLDKRTNNWPSQHWRFDLARDDLLEEFRV